MNPVAVTFGVVTVFVLAFACCGRDRLVKVAAAYLFASWLVSNFVFLALSPGSTLDVFAYLDLGAASLLVAGWIWKRAVWAGLLGTLLYGQVIFNIAHKFDATTEWQAYFINDFLFALQLAAIAGATLVGFFGKPRRPTMRRRARRPARVRDSEKPDLRLVA